MIPPPIPSASATASAAASTTPPRRGGRVGHWFVIIFAAMLVVAVVEAASAFRLNREAREVQSVALNIWPEKTETQVQFTVGRGLIGLAQIASSFIDDVPSEARDMLSSVHEASVGVYQLSDSPNGENRLDLMTRATAQLEREGWTRVVGVLDGDDTVMVFMPNDFDSADNFDVCIAVCSGTDLVVVSATGDIEPILRIAQKHRGGWSKEFKRATGDERFASL